MSSDPRTADAVLFLLTNISIDHALANAFGTYAAVKKMYDAAMMACLLSCETEYYLAVSHLQSAIQYLAEKNYFDGISALQSAFDDVTTCEDTFNEPRFQPVKSPLIQKNQIAKYLCNISFEFERLLEPSTKTLVLVFVFFGSSERSLLKGIKLLINRDRYWSFLSLICWALLESEESKYSSFSKFVVQFNVDARISSYRSYISFSVYGWRQNRKNNH